MNAFDYNIILFLNHFEGRHPSFDGAVVSLSNNGFLRGGIIAALCWWAWFQNGEDRDKNLAARATILSAMAACCVSIVFARLAVLAFPFRVRPLCDPANGLHFPPSSIDWENWSSFPSDHAIMFCTLTTCLFFISRALGWIALLDTLFLVCLPRIYLGIHYPTDILAGAAIGVGFGFLANQETVKSFVTRGAFQWMQRHPGSFYAVFFLFMYQVTVIFWDVRSVAAGCLKLFLKPVKEGLKMNTGNVVFLIILVVILAALLACNYHFIRSTKGLRERRFMARASIAIFIGTLAVVGLDFRHPASTWVWASIAMIGLSIAGMRRRQLEIRRTEEANGYQSRVKGYT